jgi:hypothetical protein
MKRVIVNKRKLKSGKTKLFPQTVKFGKQHKFEKHFIKKSDSGRLMFGLFATAGILLIGYIIGLYAGVMHPVISPLP